MWINNHHFRDLPGEIFDHGIVNPKVDVANFTRCTATSDFLSAADSLHCMMIEVGQLVTEKASLFE